ncbi:phage tail tape measure protein [Acinetobacter johnsonii]|uniref:Phage tail tape measure protein n=1 Tax=Acinetobacter johnsonii TaxID=40214 RepID=A0AA42IDK2_ACIJO|nr:phage tail tape measure protein [Acinetobacter johnsonii]MDH0655020.1 phage tail tape measure protein [Acinetobacter johnsonii]
MAQAGVIRDFMVALGFKTDNSGLKQMQDAMGGVENKANLLKGALMALATGAIIAVRQTASELDKLYFSSQRIGASVTNINAYGNAIAQLGGSAEGAIGSLESLAEKMRNSPGYESQINSLGVQTKDANGAMRDRVEVMKDLSGVLSKMPAHQANAYASSLGIDQNTLLAMRDGKFVSNMDKYQKIQKELGMNDDLAKSGNEFMSEYRDLTMMTKTGFQVIVMQAGKALIPILKLLNTLIMAGVSAFSQLNPQIKEGLGIALRFGMAALVLGAFIKTFGMIFKFIPMLKGFIGLLKLFRLAFLASPIGIILALASALYLLYDDYKTWKEGGKSLIDWSKWTNGIDKIIAKIKDFLAMLEKVKDKVVNFVQKIISDPVEAIKEVVDIAKDEAKNIAQKGADALNDKIAETETGRKALDAVGSGVAKTLAFLGNKEAQKAVEINEGKSAVTAKDIALGTAKAVQNAVKEAALSTTKESNKIVSLIKTEGTKRIYQMGNGETETRTGGTVAWRNNNPGNLKFEFKGSADKTVKSKRTKDKALSDAKKRYAGVVALDQWGNAVFETMEAGAIAKAKLLKKQHGNKTFQQMLRGYAVDDYSGKTNYEAYEATINKTAAAKGVSLKGKKIGEMSQAEFAALAEGMVKAEGLREGKISRTGTTATQNKTPQGAKALASFAQNADIPKSNPHKSQVSNSSNMTASNVTIHQSFTTDMTINGAREPIESANAVKRQQENQLAFMARNAMSPLAG